MPDNLDPARAYLRAHGVEPEYFNGAAYDADKVLTAVAGLLAATAAPAAPLAATPGENPLAVVAEVLRDWLDENEATDFDENDVAHLYALLGTAGYSILPNNWAVPLNDAELAELARLEGLATKGPWGLNDGEKQPKHKGRVTGHGMFEWALNLECFEFPENNRNLIVAMRNALPGLLARLAAAEAQLVRAATVLHVAETALAGSYDVMEYPGDGSGFVAEALAVVRTFTADHAGKEPRPC